MTIRFVFSLFVCLLLEVDLSAQAVKCGPMVGHVQLRDAIIWVQTIQASDVRITYLEEGSDAAAKETNSVKSELANDHIVTFYLRGLTPGTKYKYQVWVGRSLQVFPYELSFTTQTHWQYRTEPPSFRFVAGSCAYVNDPDFDRPGKGYGSNYQIYKYIDSLKPAFLLWLGDNTYLREGDFESRAGIFNRQSHTRSLAEMRPLMAHTPNYAIWDDHDYGTNDANRTFRLKNHSLDAFKAFWPTEYYHTNGLEGITHSYVYNDCEFFMLDNRWYKTADTSGTLLGRTQLDWFKESLMSSQASFKFVAIGGQFLSDFKGYENVANYARERQEMIDFIDQNKIKNVIFLTGDRHHSEVTKLVTKNGVSIYDITSSALTSSTYDHSKEPNTLRVAGSIFGVNNFAEITITGDRKNRKLGLRFIDSYGKELYKYDF
jgi:alkaline phosphatase D